ncbi:hypothetical protein B0J13DRAFT_517830 [Dactylonectria estremocensis]|uniref:NADH dehydrogenase [ubiquinone] 1 alpha subcomplex subunit n=1 Tax=Dactylonectria estremocensis TaxID=1079267 RepID=A0A9P9FKF3_9HYPO|nr:hypothetical protein B0J13DRAFT_517830 [Dactylonectria estremocensis]
MAPKRIGPVAQAWYKWKTLRLPWRKRYLMGYDLEGNTYWEFRLTRGTGTGERWRRIVNYPRGAHYSQVKVNPQWHQWLRHTRQEPPTLEEQHDDVLRQARVKVLAAQADARWEAKPRVMEAPEETTQRLPPAQEAEAQPATSRRTKSTTEEIANGEDPWVKARKAQGPSENWQPGTWTPTPAKKR